MRHGWFKREPTRNRCKARCATHAFRPRWRFTRRSYLRRNPSARTAFGVRQRFTVHYGPISRFFNAQRNGCNRRQVVEKIGGASRDRTDDLIVANDALSQLSYSPTVRVSRVFLFYQRSPIRTKNASAYHRVPQCFLFGKTS